MGEEVTRVWPEKVSSCYDVRANKIGHRNGGNVTMFQGKNNRVGGVDTLCAASVEDRIHNFEYRLNGLKEDLRRQKEVLASKRAECDRVCKDKRDFTAVIQRLQSEISSTKRHCTELSSRVSELESFLADQAGKGLGPVKSEQIPHL